MPIRYVLLVNKQGQTRLSKYFTTYSLAERMIMEDEVIKKCLGRNSQQCSFLEYRDHKLIYRRYASLFIIMGVDKNENELAILEVFLIAFRSLFFVPSVLFFFPSLIFLFIISFVLSFCFLFFGFSVLHFFYGLDNSRCPFIFDFFLLLHFLLFPIYSFLC